MLRVVVCGNSINYKYYSAIILCLLKCSFLFLIENVNIFLKGKFYQIYEKNVLLVKPISISYKLKIL